MNTLLTKENRMKDNSNEQSKPRVVHPYLNDKGKKAKAKRVCLRCDKPFESASIYNRLCYPCRHNGQNQV